MSADRPYFNKSIAELEALCAASEQDPLILGGLQVELRHRKTDRAAALRDRVEQCLAAPKRPGVNAASAPAPTAAPSGRADHPPRTAIPAQPIQPQRPATAKPAPPAEPAPPPTLFAPPSTRDEPAAVLAAWTALEALSPQTYRRPEDLAAGDGRCVAELTRGELPWVRGETSRPNRQLYYQVVLGSIPMDRATDELIKAFGEDEERSRREREKAPIAAVLVDRRGLVLEEGAVAVSSFAWALPLALQRQLGSLGAWTTVERKIVEQLETRVRRKDANGNPLPIDPQTITDAYRWLVRQLRLPSDLVEPPTFVLRVFHYYRAKSPPELALLNSFFLSDLARASSLLQAQKAGTALRRYLGVESPKNTINLLEDRSALEAVVAPAVIPAARWPAPGSHPLVTLQQAAVDVARLELSASEGIVAVNGPPGTGKTTLLRDVVASCVLDRALAMAKFDDPEAAFKASGQRVSAGDSAFFHLYKLDESLRGHEVLVVSSNNKAVENVSKELPAAKAIGRSTDELSYFKTVSDQLLARPSDWDTDPEATEPIETWGLIAAVLGNAKNRASFQQNLWWHDENALRLYLKAAKGDSVVREIKDPDSGEVVKRETPAIISQEDPPTPATAKTNWPKAKRRLLDLQREVENEIRALERVRQTCVQLAEARKMLASDEATYAAATRQLTAAQATASALQDPLSRASAVYERAAAAAQMHRRKRPGWLSRLFGTKKWTQWVHANEPLVRAERAALEHLTAVRKQVEQAEQAVRFLANNLKTLETRLVASRQKVAGLAKSVDAHRNTLGNRIVDDAFFDRGHEAWNLASPWLPDSLHRKREDLFIAAMAAHKAFIDASAQKVLHNLSALMDAMTSGSFQDEAKRALLGDLWSTLFLVIPVVSTTFASVDRMLGDLAAGSIGWLLVDEAGQALPQAAVGALMRAKRAIVVGDPLQIPPVVSLPEKLSSEICAFFKVRTALWAAPEASSQTVADRASRYQAAFSSDQGPRHVGVPLLVHRRCQEPMFGVSNRIAYDGQMVHAPGVRDAGLVGRALGPSAWLNIDGEAESKWCPAEGELVASLLGKIAKAGVVDPDVYVITPFRIVAQELRRRLEREQRLFSAFGVDQREWLQNRVGTIHTFQGKEAETVIVVLGAPKASQHGARRWAAGTPNLLNVTVSRAKQNLYVVGSRGAWSGVGHCRELARALPSANA